MGHTIPILTNGYEWVVFNRNAFIINPKLPVGENANAVLHYWTLRDDINILTDAIKKQ